ncbi:hypothetical protein CBS147343_8617 [Aspergillus niger]|nr:hypothetical protein CBS12448_7945 [Aspergillus niger]KAI2908206.1 hypothetical protein CBS147371_10248 [Aspergillus niger]KAI2942322.1 hypothetical protein CBS147322_8972 [Aspergillus niger]KAI2980814.1 hypothetical protein CBS147344_10085 [Aspergillus niger]KAI3025464.1 hypothetical protein CBS147482_1051 [Aspergillus niger]
MFSGWTNRSASGDENGRQATIERKLPPPRLVDQLDSLRGACLQCLDFKLPPRLLVVQCLCDFPNQAFSQNSVGLDPSFDPPPTTQ